MDETNVSLLDRLRGPASPADWERLVRLYQPFIRGILGRTGLQDADLDDLTGDVLKTLVERLPTFQHNGERGAFRTWLRLICGSRRADWLRRLRGRTTNELPDDELADPDSELSKIWEREHNDYVVKKLLELLEPQIAAPTWQAFRLQVIDGKSAAEVAAQLGSSVNAVLIAKSRVLARFRAEAKGLLD